MFSNREIREARLRLIERGELFAYWSMELHEGLLFHEIDFGIDYRTGKHLRPASLEEVKAEFAELSMREKAELN